MTVSLRQLGLLGLLSVSIVGYAADKFTVATTFTIIADMAQNVAGEQATVVSITKPGAEIHGYEPTPKDIVRAQEADLILWNGMYLERWFEKFFASIDGVPSVVVSEGVEPMSISGGEYDGKPNPHAWMSASSAKIYIDNIEQALSQYDPEHAADYAANAAAYKAQIEVMDQRIREGLETIPEAQRWLVTSEGAFSYLARDYDLKEAYLWPINAEQQGSPQQVSALIETVRDNDIPVVFSESTISDKPAKQVAKETDAIYGGVLYVDSLSEAGGVVPTYLDLLDVTTQTIIDGFQQALER
ncbi:metal ABC transporter substrate-binding protein [Suttonella sp. R2A3]|uniref:metal ABC transporter substrate-binding protein n=1 Tax=Suttonella sp. R2A3 TaxID=2908648 RepID=UPI00288089AB|nr:metal ABC transporter substrate-binding protein [Suttonella sp. R2A3]